VPLTATNLFSDPPGLALVVRGWYGEELARTYASSSLTSSNFIFSPASSRIYKLLYGAKPTVGGRISGLSLRARRGSEVSLRIEGTFSGSGYTNNIVSNVIFAEVK
jgi:hypothetical protein